MTHNEARGIRDALKNFGEVSMPKPWFNLLAGSWGYAVSVLDCGSYYRVKKLA